VQRVAQPLRLPGSLGSLRGKPRHPAGRGAVAVAGGARGVAEAV